MKTVTLLMIYAFLFAFPPLFAQTNWQIETIDSAINWPGSSVSIAVDDQGDVHVANGAYPGVVLRYARTYGDCWEVRTIDDYPSGLCASIALDGKGRPVFAHVRHSGGIPWLTCTSLQDTTFVDESIDPAHDDMRTSIRVSAVGIPHIAYGEWTDPYRLKHAWKEGGAWNFEVADETTGSGNDIGMALTPEGSPCVSHFGAPNYGNPPWQMRFSLLSGGSWHHDVVDDNLGNFNVIQSAVALDSGLNPHIAFFSNDMFAPELRYAYYDGTGWSVEVVDDNLPWFGSTACSMVLDSLDRPHIVYGTLYQQVGGNSELRYATLDSTGAWVIEVIDSTDDAGELNSLAIDPQGYLHVAYFRGNPSTQDGEIMYATNRPESLARRCRDPFVYSVPPSESPPDTLWTRTYGGTATDWGSSVQETSDGGFIIVGTTGSFGPSEDVYLIKTDGGGDTLWTRKYGGPSDEWGISVQETSDGGYILVGKTDSFGAGNSDYYLVRTDENGDSLWTRTYGGNANDIGRSVRQTTDGGYIVVGETYSFGAGDQDIYLVKTDGNGDALWTRTYGGANGEGGNSVRQTTDGGYIIAGWTASYGAGNGDVYLIKTDESGNVVWERTYGASDNDVGYSVQQTDDNGYIVAGWTYSFSFESDFYLVRTDENGDALWTGVYGQQDGANNEARSVWQTSDGGYVAAGYTNESGIFFDVYLLKVDALGTSQWIETYGGDDNDLGYSVQQTSDGGFIVAGYTASFGAGGDDVYLIRLKPDLLARQEE